LIFPYLELDVKYYDLSNKGKSSLCKHVIDLQAYVVKGVGKTMASPSYTNLIVAYHRTNILVRYG
ncbi:hypothetical protein ACJX0J_024684, partial [Zea mays]